MLPEKQKSHSPHLFVDISSHGFGHIAQIAPVLNELRCRIPGLMLTVQCAVPVDRLQSRIHGAFKHICVATDFGMCMANAVEVLVEESAQAYTDFHQNWASKVAQQAEVLQQNAPDLVFSDVSYLSLAAAKLAGIPAVGMCSLNWADIYEHYCSGLPGAADIHQQMLKAYNSAEGFVRLQPSMPMPQLQNALELGPIGQTGINRRAEINAKLGLNQDVKLVLIAMGGIQMCLPVDQWPCIEGVKWIVQRSWGVYRPDAIELEALGMNFIDILCSCDALITKPGYGSFAEAAVNGVLVLYLRRFDWPEEVYLVDWLSQFGRCLEVQRNDLEKGAIATVLDVLWKLPLKPPVLPVGIVQVADVVEKMLNKVTLLSK